MKTLPITFTSEEAHLRQMVKSHGYHSKERTAELQAELDKLRDLRDAGRPGHDSKISRLESIIKIRGFRG